MAHYALTVCCKYPSLAESIRVWRYPVAEEQAFIRTQLEESTRAHVAGAVVVLGESDEIGKWLSQHFGLVAAAVNSTWYRLNTYTNRHGHRVVLMQVMHPYWGSVAGALASRLFSYGCVELVHCGNVGRLMPTVETSLTIVSAPHRACHVTSLQSIKIKNPLLKWLRDNPPAVKLFPDHVHISIASPVLETKEMIEQWAACSTIDVEVFSLAKAAAEAKRPLSCLHYVSDVVGSTHSLGDKWEDSLKSGAPQARHAMIVSVSTYLSQLGKK